MSTYRAVSILTMEPGTQEKILATAKDLFATQGFKSTSMADIAAHVGITKAGLYYFFKNKESLYGAIVDEALCEAYAHLERTLRASNDLYDMITALIEVGTRMGASFRSIEPGALDRTTVTYKQIVQRFEDMRRLVVACIQQNELREPDVAAEVVLNAVHAYVVHAQCGIPRIPEQTYARYLATMIGHTHSI